LMGLLATKGAEAIVRNDVSGAEVLELRAIGASFLGQGHELKGTIEVAIVVGRDVGNEIGRLVRANQTIT